MGRNNKENRKKRAGARVAELKRNRLRECVKNARIDRDPRSVRLQNAMIDTFKEYTAAGKTPAEAKALIAAELKNMLPAKELPND